MATSLLAHLHAEAEVLREAAGLLQELNSSLRQASPSAIESSQERQEGLASRLAGLRAARVELTRQAGEGLGIAASEVTISAIAARLTTEEARHLRAACETTYQVARHVDSLNRRNAALARHGLAHVQERLDQLSPGPGAGCYRPDGRTAPAPRGSFIEFQG